MSLLHAFGMLLVLLTAALTLGGIVAALVAIPKHRLGAALAIFGALAAWDALHLGVVGCVSAREPARTLAPGQAKRFCGFYLDCHLGAAVMARQRPAEIAGKKAQGTWEVVTVEISSNARAATLEPYGLQAMLVDSSGKRFTRDSGAERAWQGAHGEPASFEQPVAPHGAYRKDLVFDVPADARGLALDIRERGLPDDVLEWLLPGDDDSFMHKPVLLELPLPWGG
ncbi:MAG TPA: hypothetical protein VGR66_03940 [Candidatus Eisenbacteria bacterium]|jgi:hypothetical protein|nr:hypothetical protein [Candidatus Eisenbacteria bacterium]